MWTRTKQDLRDPQSGIVAGPVAATEPETTATAMADSATAVVSDGPPFHLRPIPILVALVAIFALWLVSTLILDVVGGSIRLAALHNTPLPSLYLQHLIQVLLALGAIQILRRYIPADYGLHMPEGRSYIATAIVLSMLFGLLLALVQYGPSLVSHTAPKLDYPFTGLNVAGWLVYKGAFVGPTEEIPYRALLVTYLSVTMPGTLRWRGFHMNGAGIVMAAILALWELPGAFINLNPLLAAANVILLFVAGASYAYWFEKSRSILAPIVGHNVCELTQIGVLFGLVAWLR